MSDRSQMNFYPAPNRFSYGTPKRQSPYSPGPRQPLYLHPSSPHLSPRFRKNRSDSEMSSPDFLPLGFSSPRNQNRKGNSWNNSGAGFRNHSNNSSFSSPGSYSSFNHSNYGSHRRSRGSFYNSSNNSGSTDITLYCDKSMLEDPWTELEERDRKINEPLSADVESSSSSDDDLDNQEGTGSGGSNEEENDDDDDDDNDDIAGDDKDDSSS